MTLRFQFLRLVTGTTLLFLSSACKNNSANPHGTNDSTNIEFIGEDTVKWSPDTTKFYAVDTTGFGNSVLLYNRVKNLLHFHTRDTMKTDSTYVATLYMAKNISGAELDLKVKDIVEPNGKVKVEDTTQEIGVYMSATLEDKAPENDHDFSIELSGGKSALRKYDEKKNKMVWQWKVTPRKEGNHDLILSIAQVDEKEIPLGSPEMHRHSITIFSSKHSPGIAKGIGGFFEKYWQWLLGAIALPIFIAWFTTKRRKAMNTAQTENKPMNGNWKRKNRHR